MLPEFHKERDIHWTMFVDESPRSDSRYDMIIGRDLMPELGFKFDFENGQMEWDNAIVPMRDVSCISDKNVDSYENEIYYSINPNDPETTDAERIQ